MEKKILIQQPGFLGDVIFVMAIAQKYLNDGYDVDFPVFDNIFEIPIDKYFPGIKFTPIGNVDNNIWNEYTSKLNLSGYTVFSLSHSPNIGGGYKHMGVKYDIVGMPVNDWHNVEIKRDAELENKLLENLEIKDGDKFNLINENYQWSFFKKPIVVNNGLRNVHMQKIDGFSVFDWMGVMERAETVHTVGTSAIFLLDSLKITPKEMHIYRRDDKDHSTYDYLLTKNFIYH